MKYKPCDELTSYLIRNILEHLRSQQFEFIVDKALGTKVRIKKSCVSQSVGKDGRDVLSDPSTAKDGVVARDTEIHWNHVYTSFTPVPLYRSGATGKKLLAKYRIRNPLSGHKFTDIHEFKSSDPNVLSLYQFGTLLRQRNLVILRRERNLCRICCPFPFACSITASFWPRCCMVVCYTKLEIEYFQVS